MVVINPYNGLGWIFLALSFWELYRLGLYYINILKLRNSLVGHTNIDQHSPSDGVTVGGPLARILSLRKEVDGVQGRGAETCTMVAADGSRCQT